MTQDSAKKRELEILQRLEQAKLDNNKTQVKIWTGVLAKIRAKRKV